MLITKGSRIMKKGAKIRILSADAPKVGVLNCAEAFATATGQAFKTDWATAPIIKRRMGSANARADVLVAPLIAMEEFSAGGTIRPDSVSVIGTVTVGVVVRNGAREPDLSTVESFTKAVLAADKIIYNVASSGQYVAEMFDKIGLADKLKTRTLVLDSGMAVMQYLADKPSDNMIGFGHVTAIRFHDYLGTHLVGPLPGAIGRETPYSVGVLSTASNPQTAGALAGFMTSREGKRLFVESGVL